MGTVNFTKDSSLGFLGKSRNMGLVRFESIEWNKYTNRCDICNYFALNAFNGHADTIRIAINDVDL